MINFFKKNGALILMFLMFPIMWPVYAVYELARSTSVTHDDCLTVWSIWMGGTAVYGIACAVLWGIYQLVLMTYANGYLVHTLIGLGVVIAIFIAPEILYYIFKNKKKINE